MADLKVKYPAANADTVAITITLTSLASSAARTAGRQSTPVDNRTNLDLDHLVSGRVTLGTSPTPAGKSVEVWAFAPISIAAGTPTYPDAFSTSDEDRSVLSENARGNELRLLWVGVTDATTDRVLYMPPTSIAGAFGGVVPPFWGIWVVHDSGVNLNATAGNHVFHYHRVQAQTTV